MSQAWGGPPHMPYRPPPRKSGASTVLIVLAVVGGLGVLAVLCCGGGVFYLAYMGRQRAAELRAEMEAMQAQPTFESSMPNGQAFSGPPPVTGPPPPSVKSVGEALTALQSREAAKQKAALDWLARSRHHAQGAAEREQIAVELEATLSNPALEEQTLDVLADWATQSNLASLQKIADRNAGPHVKAKVALARLKDERATVQIAKLLSEFGQTDVAKESLEAIGPAAEAEVVKRFNDSNNWAREAARDLLRTYRTKHETIVAQSALDVASGDAERRKQAAEWLASAAIDESQRPAVALALEKMLVEETWNRELAARALAKWATKENVPGLIGLLNHEDRRLREQAIDVLVQLKEPSAAAPIAAGLEDFFLRGKSIEALRKLGSIAEPAVIPYLRHSDAGVRIEACRLLKDIGGVESTAALEAAFRTDQDGGVRNEAQRALVALATIESGIRKWADKTGMFNVEAQFLEVKDGKAFLKKKDGMTISVPVTQLSEEDQLYIRNEQKRRRFLNGA